MGSAVRIQCRCNALASGAARRVATTVAIAAGVAVALASTPAAAQSTTDQDKQDDLETVHSVLQKSGLVTLGLTGASGFVLLANKPTLFGEGRCKSGSPWLGDFGCGGLVYVHLGTAVASLGLFIAQEVVAGEMPISPYDMGSEGRRDAMAGLRVANYSLFALQPVLGFLAANPGVIGIPESSQEDFSKVVRTIHFGVGGGLATTYTVNAALQW